REAAAAHRTATPLAEIKQRLHAIAEAASRFSSDFDGDRALNAAIERAYKRGRNAMQRAAAGRSTDDLHEWRKHAKHLWHLLKFSRRRIARPTKKLANRLNALAELLGLDHDHAMLAEKLALGTHDRSLNHQLAVIATQRGSMEDEA